MVADQTSCSSFCSGMVLGHPVRSRLPRRCRARSWMPSRTRPGWRPPPSPRRTPQVGERVRHALYSRRCMAVYLDHAATTPMPEEVLAAYTDALRLVGNPSSIHANGQAAQAHARGCAGDHRGAARRRPYRGHVHLRWHGVDQPRDQGAVVGVWWSSEAETRPDRRPGAPSTTPRSTLSSGWWRTRGRSSTGSRWMRRVASSCARSTLRRRW